MRQHLQTIERTTDLRSTSSPGSLVRLGCAPWVGGWAASDAGPQLLPGRRQADDLNRRAFTASPCLRDLPCQEGCCAATDCSDSWATCEFLTALLLLDDFELAAFCTCIHNVCRARY